MTHAEPHGDELTTRAHWEDAWAAPPRWRLPSGLIVASRNIQRVLAARIRPGMSVLELGCAPGKMLAWAAASLGARVAGLDYSEQGIAWASRLFEALRLDGDLRREDVFATSFEPGSFDVVYSWGLIEHFDDPGPIVRAHLRLVRPGGTAIIGIPNYGGLYGRLQGWLDADNLHLHNRHIMSPDRLAALAPSDLSAAVQAYAAGRLSPWLLNFDKRMPAPLARLVSYGLNGVGLLQPVDVTPLCPLLVLEIKRR